MDRGAGESAVSGADGVDLSLNYEVFRESMNANPVSSKYGNERKREKIEEGST